MADQDVDLALDHLADIRARLARSTEFLGLSPAFNGLLAVLALLLALGQAGAGFALDLRSFVSLWSVFLLTSSGMACVDAVSRARREHGPMANPILLALLYRLAPFVLATVLMSWVIWSLSPQVLWLLPGLWQVMLALLGFATLTSLPRGVAWVAAWYLVTGVWVMAMAAEAQTLSPWMMGLPLAVGQLGVGLALARAARGAHAG